MKATVAILGVLALAGGGQADFILTGDEYLAVYGPHATGLLLDSSRVGIRANGEVDNLSTYNTSKAHIVTNGSVGWADAYDSSSVKMSGGWISNTVQVHDSSRFDISSGSSGGI